MTAPLARSRGALLSAAVAVLALVLSGPPAQASAEPALVPPDGVEFQIVSVNGSGCPAGTTTIDRWTDGKTVRVVYHAFTAEAGTGAPPTAFRRQCTIVLSVNAPAGWTYGFNGVYTGGWGILPAGASGTVVSTAYFAGHSETDQYQHAVAGPLVGDWAADDDAGPAAVTWATCGEHRDLVVGVDVRASAPATGPRASMIVDASAFDSHNDLYWRQCA
jgi:hypothetical protein